jgi:methylmalonyl-CoA/ethylmalonyl-CoA epimerase
MILSIDHIGLVARSLDEASDLLLDTLGFSLDLSRTPMPDGIYMARENARIYFVQVGSGDTQLELLLPQDRLTGMGRWLDRRGPSVHHIAYMVDDVEADAAALRGKGLEQIDLGPGAGAAFFYPRSTMGILTELVDAGTIRRLHSDATAPSESTSVTTTARLGPHRH